MPFETNTFHNHPVASQWRKVHLVRMVKVDLHQLTRRRPEEFMTSAAELMTQVQRWTIGNVKG